MNYDKALLTVANAILDILGRAMGLRPEHIHPGMAFIESPLCMDSLDMVEFVMQLEKTLDIQIADGDAEGMLTVHDAVAYLQNRA